MKYDYDEFKTKLLSLGFTQKQIDDAEELDGSLGLADLANSSLTVQNCDYLEDGVFYLKLH